MTLPRANAPHCGSTARCGIGIAIGATGRHPHPPTPCRPATQPSSRHGLSTPRLDRPWSAFCGGIGPPGNLPRTVAFLTRGARGLLGIATNPKRKKTPQPNHQRKPGPTLGAPCARSMLFCLTSRDDAQGLQPRPFALPRAPAVCLFPATEGPDVWVPWARTRPKDGTEYVVTSQQQAAVAEPPSRLEPRSRDGMCCSGKTP